MISAIDCANFAMRLTESVAATAAVSVESAHIAGASVRSIAYALWYRCSAVEYLLW